MNNSSMTASGLCLSPALAASCADDGNRTIGFLAAMRRAIGHKRLQFPDRPVRILYAGCGPLAALAMPLMTEFSSSEAIFTLLDIHDASTASVAALIRKNGLTAHVSGIETVDATTYLINPVSRPDIILCEAMQAALAVEPQVAICRHLLAQAPEAVLVPERVCVDLVLADPAVEFNPSCSESAKEAGRVMVGTVFTLDRDTILGWNAGLTDRLPAVGFTLPGNYGDQLMPMLITTIGLYGEHQLAPYASGLTHPVLPVLEDVVVPGDRVGFHYRLGSQPGLIGGRVGSVNEA